MIEAVLLTSLFIWGLHAITRDGMLFGFVETFWVWENNGYADWKKSYKWHSSEMERASEEENEENGNFHKKKLAGLGKVPPLMYNPFISYPLTECPTCMASLWGSLSWWLIYAPDYSPESFGMWGVFCFAVAGLSHLLNFFDQ